jgi:Cdc6-like AAA superfamily ATPase
VDIGRDADDSELALRVDDYAAALSEVLADASGELCFALYGNWGRGKTTLARHVAKKLEARKEAPRYRTIWFNAWKYRSPPEIWAHLYTRVVEALRSDGPSATLPRIIRATLAQRGLWPATGILLSLAVSIVPVAHKLGAVWSLASTAFGALGLMAIWAGLALWKTSSVVRRIWRLYHALPDHRDKLGLQAAIGRDLRWLLRGWIPRPYVPSDPLRGGKLQDEPSFEATADDRTPGLPGVLAFAATVLLVAGVAWHTLASVASAGTLLRVGIPSIWVVLSAAIIRWVKVWGRETERLLLVVDDLDRCAPEQMLEVIEAIKLLVEEPEVRDRMQLMVLVDENVLSRAVERRFEYLASDVQVGQVHPGKRRRIVAEHLRKLFVGHLRLGPLTVTDVTELLGKLVIADSSGETAGRTLDGQGIGRTATPATGLAQAAAAMVPEPASKSIPTSVVAPNESNPAARFTEYEAVALRRHAQRLLRGSDAAYVGPRTIRSLVFRYQLCRVLLRRLGRNVDPEIIAAGLVDASLAEDVETATGVSARNAVQEILDQLSERRGEA